MQRDVGNGRGNDHATHHCMHQSHALRTETYADDYNEEVCTKYLLCFLVVGEGIKLELVISLIMR